MPDFATIRPATTPRDEGRTQDGRSRAGGADVGALAALLEQEVVERYLHRVLSLAYERRSGLRFNLETLDLSSIRPLSRVASPRRLDHAAALAANLRSSKLDVFEPAYFRLPADTWLRLSVPPIVERHGSELILFDGLHRALAAWDAGFANITVISVSGALPPAPAQSQSWDEVRVLSAHANSISTLVPKSLGRRIKFNEYRSSHFRPLGSFFNGSWFWFRSLNGIVGHVSQVISASEDDLVRCFRPQESPDDCAITPRPFWRYA